MSEQKIIFSMVNVGKSHGQNKEVLKGIHLSFFYGAKIGVLGLNGSGKSTLLKIIAGVDKNYTGEISANKDIQFGYLPQEPELDPQKTVQDIVEEGMSETLAIVKQYEAISEEFAQPDADFDALIEKQSKLQEKIEAAGAWDIQSKLNMAMQALNCPPADTKIEVLSGGEKRRVALCRLLLQKPDVLLLDEPTNHLDARSVSWLEQHLAQYEGTVIAVTHDRYFLDNVAGWILELDRGQGIPFEGNYSSWLAQKQERLAHEEKTESKRQRALKQELEWIQMNPKGRHAKSKSRISAYENMLSETHEKHREDMEIYIPPGPRLGDLVIDAANIAKSFGERTLFSNVSFSIPAGAIVGIVGPNGAGKSTLFKMITGKETPDQGEFNIGSSVQLSYVDQSRPLDQGKSIYEEISKGEDIIRLGKREMNARQYVSMFNFSGSDQQKKTSQISGGERNRVHLAKALAEGGNVILLDEPTNDLDVNTLRALEEALLQFVGCAVVISHDRWFLDRVATHILAFEDNEVLWFDGNYTQYQTDFMRRYGNKDPNQVKYSKLTY